MAAKEAAASPPARSVMVVAVDDREHSYNALEWTLRHFAPPGSSPSAFKLVVVYAKPTATSAVGLAGPGITDVLPLVESDLNRLAGRVVEKAKQICYRNGVNDVDIKVMEGDARNILCEAVEKLHADMLVLGSHGYGAFKRMFLGSVSDYCAHHARCSVMIVKKPSSKH